MKKQILFLVFGLLLLTGCMQDEEKVDSFHFDGKIIAASNSWNLLTVFVEDNYGGYDVDWQGFKKDIDNSQYWVEAYRIELTDETIFVNEDGEEFTLELDSLALDQETVTKNEEIFELFGYLDRGISVKVKEDFQQQLSDNRSDYILYSQEFLPIYTAEKIQFYPLSYDDFLSVMRGGISEYVVMMIYDSADAGEFHPKFDEYWQDLNELSDQIFNDRSAHIYLSAMELNSFLKYPVPVDGNEYPFYLILDGDDELIEMTEWDDVLNYFLDTYGNE